MTFHKKTRLIQNSVFGAFETPPKRHLTAFQTLHKHFANGLQTPYKRLQTLFKPFQTPRKWFANSFKRFSNLFQTLHKPFKKASIAACQTLYKRFANPLQSYFKVISFQSQQKQSARNKRRSAMSCFFIR